MRLGKSQGRGVKNDLSGFTVLSFIIGIISGYVNGGVNGALAGFLITIILLIVSLIGLVPFAGIFLYMYIANHLKHTLHTYVTMSGGITFTILYWLNFVSSLVLTVITSIAVLMIIVETRKGL